MRSQQFAVRTWLKYHWFWPAAAIFGLDALNAHILAATPRVMEGIVLFDSAIVIPALYLFCYRRNGRKAVVKAIAFRRSVSGWPQNWYPRRVNISSRISGRYAIWNWSSSGHWKSVLWLQCIELGSLV
jgi:hypothetical protein